MLLTAEQFRYHAAVIHYAKGHVGFDFETDGLSAYKGARAFIMGFTNTEGHKFCVRDMEQEAMRVFFSNPNLKYCPHNGKFELSFLREQFGVEVMGTIWDTEVFARVASEVKLNHGNYKKIRYSLQACAERVGLSKHKPMLEWLKKRGNKAMYHKAPAELIEPYVEQDAWLSWELARQQMNTFRHWDTSGTKIGSVVDLELRTTPHLFNMESRGLMVDVGYCMRAREYEQEQADEARRAFELLTGTAFVDSAKTLAPIFDAHGICYGRTELGNPSFTEELLEGNRSHPIVAAVLKYRSAKKRVSSYWENFLELEHNGLIHPSINQNRAHTGRMSIQDPSCQNWSRDDDDPKFPIRRAFIARPGCVIASLDYSQMELRLICDEADDTAMITAIQEGVDFHQQVADQAKVPRTLAKSGRFAKLYGAGVRKVAETLGIDEDLARSICSAIDESSPRVAEYTRELIQYAEGAPYVCNFLGRRYYLDYDFTYKFPNYKIQGGCGEILRVAMSDVANFLESTRNLHRDTGMLIPIHDELVLNVHHDDLWVLPEVKRLMVAAHRSKKTLEMDVSVHVGPNFYDLEAHLC